MADHATHSLLVGLGSHHGDDQVGWLLADALSRKTNILCRQAAVPADLLHWLDGIDNLYLCDACQGAGPIGKLHRWEYRSPAQSLDDILPGIESLRSVNTHQLSLAAVLSLACSLHLLPGRIVVWAIEGGNLSAGQQLSIEMTNQLPQLISQLANEFHHA